jgi:hypothetical protein
MSALNEKIVGPPASRNSRRLVRIGTTAAKKFVAAFAALQRVACRSGVRDGNAVKRRVGNRRLERRADLLRGAAVADADIDPSRQPVAAAHIDECRGA